MKPTNEYLMNVGGVGLGGNSNTTTVLSLNCYLVMFAVCKSYD